MAQKAKIQGPEEDVTPCAARVAQCKAKLKPAGKALGTAV